MILLLGTVLAGTVERVDLNSIKTKFLVLGLPLIPLGSYYVLESPRSFTMNAGMYKTVDAKLHWKSVGLGYLRMYSWLPTVLFWNSPLPRWMGLDWTASAYAGLGLFVVWACIAFFGLGRLSRKEVECRRRLREATGFAVDRALLAEVEDGRLRQAGDDGSALGARRERTDLS